MSGLGAAVEVARAKQHRVCILVRLQGGDEEKRALSTRVARLCSAKSVLLCSRQAFAGDYEFEATSWAFGQVRKVACLGSTFDAAVIFDPEEIMPETLWAAAETVRGGGIVCIVPQLATGHTPEVTRRGFFDRLMTALQKAPVCIEVDEALEPLKPVLFSNHDHAACPEFAEVKAPSAAGELTAILALSCNRNQREVLLAAFQVLGGKDEARHQVVISGRRGRGKSTTVGLLIAALAGLARHVSTIVVTAPTADNASEMLGWARHGLAVLGQGCLSIDQRGSFCASRHTSSEGTADGCQILVSDVETSPQLLVALAAMGHRVFVVVDEVASVAIPAFKSILSAPFQAMIMAGTTSSCEGTGSALEWKVLLDTAKPNGKFGFKQTRFFLTEPVRYGHGCQLEELLDSVLFLGAGSEHSLHELGSTSDFGPRNTRLLEVDQALLADSTNGFAKALVAVLQTHYRTSASDISMMSQEYVRTMVLVHDAAGDSACTVSPSPLVVLLCILEAPELLPSEKDRGSSRLSRSHLTTFCLEQDFPQLQLSGLRGLRVARVVCDPRLRSCGFGSEAVRQLVSCLKDGQGSMESLQDATGSLPLRRPQLSSCSWLAASFGLTEPLLRFWSRLGLRPVALAPAPNPQTGEVSVVMLKSLAAGQLEVGLRALPSEFQRRLLQRLPKVDESLSAAVLLNLVTYEHSVCQYPLRMNEQELAQLQRLAESRDSLSCLPHCAELVQKLCQAYFGGQLAPLKLPKEDEEQLLALGRAGGCFKDVPLSASLGASARRVALEASKKMAIGLDKEMELSLRPSSGDQVFRSWLPKFNTAAIALVLRSGEGEDGPKLLCSADWLYPIEAECGELHLSASLAAAHRPIGWLPDCLVLCRCLLRRQDCHWQLEATCFHRWQVQEWSASSAVLEEGRQLLRFEVQEVPVQLVGHQPSTADVQIMLTLREPFVSAMCPMWGRAWLPLGAMGGKGEVQLRLEVHNQPESWLVVRGSWEFPMMHHGQVQRNRGLFRLNGLELLGATSPPELLV
ncbi:unnamed protein product, partial [Durusdinium trenchii]